MAGTSKKCSTMQGLKTPVSASGQGGKAGPPTSSSCNRSSSSMGDLVGVESHATSKKRSGVRKSHDCPKKPNSFCYICSRYEVSSLRKTIDDEIGILYKKCFGRELLHQEENWVPHIICNACRLMLYRLKNSKQDKYRRYSTPTIWKKPSSVKDCYFCMNDIRGITAKNKNAISYINVSTVIRATEVSSEVCESLCDSDKDDVMEVCSQPENDVMEVCNQPENVSDDIKSDTEEDSITPVRSESEGDEYVPRGFKSKVPLLLSQAELNDFVRDLGLPKDGAEYAASFLKNRNFLMPTTKVSFYRTRDEEFKKYYTKDKETSLVYCTDVAGLMDQLKKNVYKDEDWRLFIDSSKRSIKAVLLHNTNEYAPIPIAHSTVIKEEYNNVRMLLDKILYSKHKWQICGDLKIITMILGQQSGFTREPCFLCLWNSRDRVNHYSKKQWPERKSFEIGFVG